MQKIEKLDMDMNIYSLFGNGINIAHVQSSINELQSKINEIIDVINKMI